MSDHPVPIAVPIALVEDHAALRAELAFHLEHAGYRVTGLADGAALDAHLACQPCQLVVLDLGLPGEDGLSVCARLRHRHPGLGVVILTARGLAHDRLSGWQRGADAYLVKPAPPAELLAVIANLLGRLRPAVDAVVPAPAPAPVAAATPAATSAAISAATSAAASAATEGWCLRLRSRVLIGPRGASVALTHADCALLHVLLRCAPQPATRRQLVEALGGHYLTFEGHRLDVAVSRLRGKLAQAWPGDDTIRAARCVGYQFTRACAQADA